MCDLLADTGVAGCPNSFFRRQSLTDWAHTFNVSVAAWSDHDAFDQAYLAAALRQGAGGTKVFGMRLMWENVGDLSRRLSLFYPDLPDDRARFRRAFGPPLHVHLSRKDKVAQAVSRLRAEQSGLWHVAADGSERERIKEGQAPVYDASSLSQLIAELENHDAAWLSWFSRQGIQPVTITYEALSNDPRAVLAIVLSALGLDPAVASDVEPRTARLADGESREWAVRFRTEQRDLPG